MINLTSDFNDDVENTQRLPVLTTELQLDEALERERAVRIEIVELMRQNLQQAREIERLRDAAPHSQRYTPATEAQATIEERLFEVCGALKDTLSMVLNECRTQGFALNCVRTAVRMHDDSCDKLEQILSAPEFSAARARLEDPARNLPPAEAFERTQESRAAKVPRLELLISEPHFSRGN